MKMGVGVVVTILLIALGIWLVDIANDQAKAVKVTEALPAYSAWECGYQNRSGCSVVFEVEPGAVYGIQRVRNGKDFRAIKIHQDGVSGWLFFGQGMQIIE